MLSILNKQTAVKWIPASNLSRSDGRRELRIAAIRSMVTAAVDALKGWLVDRGYQIRLDLTYRVGSCECTVAWLSDRAAWKNLQGFVKRLATELQTELEVFAALEFQQRGAPHWHLLIKTCDGKCLPWCPVTLVREVWEKWKRWKPERHHKGIEGRMRLKYMSACDNELNVAYVVKYAAKRPTAWDFLQGLPVPCPERRRASRTAGG